jgi:hypothetical protein
MTARGIIKSALVVVVGASLLGGGSSFVKWVARGIEEDRERAARTSALCQIVMKKYDQNKDGMIEPEEGVAMARALGYQNTLPTDQLVFRLNAVGASAYFNISSPGTRGLGGSPVFYEDIYVPVERLEAAARN